MHTLFLSINWIFGLLFLAAGIDAFSDTKVGGLLFIIIALLLLPPVRFIAYVITQKEIKLGARSLYISLLFASFVLFIATGKEQRSLDLNAQSTVAANSIKQDHKNTNALANNSTGIQIKSSKKDNLPVKAVQTQSTLAAKSTTVSQNSKNVLANNTTAVQIKSEKAVQVKSRNTEQANQIKTDEILAKLKNIPVSQYEQNRSLYQQLVNFNPDENKYQKKLSFYSNKIKQQACENIGRNTTFDSSPSWLTANGHCLSDSQKKNMEIALLKKVKKISSKKVIQNWEGYKSLSILNPNKKSYLNKLKYYKNKLKVRTANS